MTFDVESILNEVPNEASQSGEKVLTAPGVYQNCTIGEIVPSEPKPEYHDPNAKNPVKAILTITFHCPDSDVELVKHLKVKERSHAMNHYTKLREAVWPDAEERAKKSHGDLAGQLVHIMVRHAPMPNDKSGSKMYDEFSFSPVN